MSSQRGPKTVGDQELALLRYVSEHNDATVGEAAAGFGQPRQLARSTVLTMMERLRKKGTSAAGWWTASIDTRHGHRPRRQWAGRWNRS